MLFHVRRPSPKKTFKALTTGAIKRKIRRHTIPFYGRKGVGFFKNPRRALLAKRYRMTSVSLRGR